MSTLSFLLAANMNWIELQRKYGLDRPGGELPADHPDARTCDLEMRELRDGKKGFCGIYKNRRTRPLKRGFRIFAYHIKKAGK